MNILILTNHLNIGGITRYVLNLSYGLKKHRHSVFVGSLPGWGVKFLEKNHINFISLPFKTKSIFSTRLIFSYFILKRIIEREKIDLIHAQTRVTQFLASLLSKRLNVAYVCTFHGFYRPHLIRKMLPCLGYLSIANSQAVGQHLIKDFNLKQENLRVIYNSIGPELTETTTEDYTYLKGVPTLGIIARLSEEKGHLVLFSAFRQLIKDYPKAKLLVVGSGREEERFKKLVRDKNLDTQIIFLGNITDLIPFFKILDISVLPSTLEGLGFSILEAQANGVPVVASAIGGITEIVRDRETGILVKPGSADELYRGIRILLEDSLLRERIAYNAGCQIKDRFSLDNMIGQVEYVYKESVGGYSKL